MNSNFEETVEKTVVYPCEVLRVFLIGNTYRNIGLNQGWATLFRFVGRIRDKLGIPWPEHFHVN